MVTFGSASLQAMMDSKSLAETCALKFPFENIVWNLPKGGSGLRYTLQ
jgi:hypothetical protein